MLIVIAKDGPLVQNGCRSCKHRENVPGNAHIQCRKPDVQMTGSPHGIRNGWFLYPLLFDPTWMTSTCRNFEPRKVEEAGHER